MAMTFRDVKGSILSNAEADANFRTLVTATQLQSVLAQLGLSGWEYDTGTHMLTITLINGEALDLGPFATP